MAKRNMALFNRDNGLTIREKQREDRKRIAKIFGIDRELTARDINRLLSRLEDYQARGLVR